MEVPNWLRSGAIQMWLAPAGGPRIEFPGWSYRKRGSMPFESTKVIPGTYDFLVCASQFSEPIAVVRGVVAAPGSDGPHDSRLSQIPVELYRYRLRAVDPSGSPLTPDLPLLVRTRTADGSLELSVFKWSGGRTEFVSGVARAEVIKLGRGVRPEVLMLTHGRHELIFEKVQPLELTLSGVRAACGERRVEVVVQPTGESAVLFDELAKADRWLAKSKDFDPAQIPMTVRVPLATKDTVQVPQVASGVHHVLLEIDDGSGNPLRFPVGRVDVSASRRVTLSVDVESLQAQLAARTSDR